MKMLVKLLMMPPDLQDVLSAASKSFCDSSEVTSGGENHLQTLRLLGALRRLYGRKFTEGQRLEVLKAI